MRFGPPLRISFELCILRLNASSNVAVLLLDLSGRRGPAFGWHAFPSIPQGIGDILGDVLSTKRYLLYARAYDVPICDRNHLCMTVASVYHNARQVRGRRRIWCSLGIKCPLGIQSQHRLHRDVQPLDVEGFEHNFSHQLTVLWRVERRLCKQEAMLLRRASKLPKNCLLQEPLHVIPMLGSTLHDWVRQQVVWAVLLSICLVSDVELQIGNTCSTRETSVDTAGLLCRVRHCRWDDKVRLCIPSITKLSETRSYVNYDGCPLAS
mmetsp:Transcript_11888/g.27718  ORF Transcript_11888/g.27718 Transcript_11888/m.27718 type:complete len:265 (+) Transcript_11888:731-1525(+)